VVAALVVLLMFQVVASALGAPVVVALLVGKAALAVLTVRQVRPECTVQVVADYLQ